MAVVITVTLVVGIVAIMMVSNQANKHAASQQRQRFQTAIAHELERMTSMAITLAVGRSHRYLQGEPHMLDLSSSEQRNHIIHTAWHLFGLNSLYVLDPEGRVLLGAENGAEAGDLAWQYTRPLVAELMATMQRSRISARLMNEAQVLSPGFERLHGRAALFHNGQELVKATVIPLKGERGREPEQGQPATLVALSELSQTQLMELASSQHMGALRFLSARSGAAPPHGLPVLDQTGSIAGHIAWQAERPADSMIDQLVLTLIITLGIASTIFSAIFAQLRHLARQMNVEDEAAARLASHDHLSGLANRRTFGERLASEMGRSSRDGEGFALLLVDLDRFKAINDTLGHQAGDAVIVEVAHRLRGALRGADMVARLGGDEFGIIQVQTTRAEDAAALAERLKLELARPIFYNGAEMVIGCSIGIAFGPTDATEAEALIKLADSALYEAKNDGRNRYRFFEQALGRSLKMKQMVEEELRDAIANDHLELHYQPQVAADGMSIVGVEALVRWRHPVKGLIPPSDFIALAEERGLIGPLSEWVLRTACRQARHWPSLRLAVNVSAVQFRQHGFVADIERIVAETGFDITRLELELTESMIVDDEEKAEQALFDLRVLGISLALDDFGTGYSSLIYLRRFSFDKIKIDRSFLDYMETTGESAILVHSVVHLGRALGLKVCAEGVETPEQHRFLQAVGCHELQGYLFSKPVPAAEIDRLLAMDAPFAVRNAA